jgi:signal transduction histidine kinase
VSEYECTEHLLDEIQRLREANYQLREGAEEQKHRIKRLEEYIHNLQKLGDSMALGRNPFIQNAWDAAKEAKP